MKVTIISNENAFKLIEEINEFIQNKKIIDIKYSSVWNPLESNSYGAVTKSCIYDRVLIMYEEKEVEDGVD